MVNTDVNEEVMAANKTMKVYIQLWMHLFTEKQPRKDKHKRETRGDSAILTLKSEFLKFTVSSRL